MHLLHCVNTNINNETDIVKCPLLCLFVLHRTIRWSRAPLCSFGPCGTNKLNVFCSCSQRAQDGGLSVRLLESRVFCFCTKQFKIFLHPVSKFSYPLGGEFCTVEIQAWQSNFSAQNSNSCAHDCNIGERCARKIPVPQSERDENSTETYITLKAFLTVS